VSLSAALFSLFRVNLPANEEREELRKAAQSFYAAKEGLDDALARIEQSDKTIPAVYPLRRAADRIR